MFENYEQYIRELLFMKRDLLSRKLDGILAGLGSRQLAYGGFQSQHKKCAA